MKKHGKTWQTSNGRVVWLLDEQFNGNRSKMASACGLSLTGVNKVINGQQEPGRRFLTAITEKMPVSPLWLLTGRGQPYRSTMIKAVNQPLPAVPTHEMEVLAAETIPNLDELYSPTRYWLQPKRDEALFRERGRKLNFGDLLLMETDRAQFPTEKDFRERLCVIRIRKLKQESFALAEVDYADGITPDDIVGLMADTFPRHSGTILRYVIEETPAGELTVKKRRAAYEPVERSRTDKPQRKEVPPDSGLIPFRISMDDIVAVSVLVLRSC